MRKHRALKRRTWRKLHIGIDPDSHEIIVAEMTTNAKGDSRAGQKMLKKTPKSVKRFYGDGAYDALYFRKEIKLRQAEALIPPSYHAAVRNHLTDIASQKRDDSILEIIGLSNDEQARKLWEKLTGYHRGSLAETAMYRIKQLTSEKMYSRHEQAQSVECCVKCLVVNKMTGLGMSKEKWVTTN
ncbi:MAG: Transposase [Chlamydiales bacterium]|nr:Transposase [Chlamydiales bacterium]